jgi:hypothetical protein
VPILQPIPVLGLKQSAAGLQQARHLTHQTHPSLNDDPQALSVVLLGLVLVAVAAVVWETSERLCPDPRFHWLRVLRLHSIWHLAIGYGVYLLLQVPPCMRCIQRTEPIRTPPLLPIHRTNPTHIHTAPKHRPPPCSRPPDCTAV